MLRDFWGQGLGSLLASAWVSLNARFGMGQPAGEQSGFSETAVLVGAKLAMWKGPLEKQYGQPDCTCSSRPSGGPSQMNLHLTLDLTPIVP